MAKKATGLSRRQIAARARNVTRQQAYRLAHSKGMGGDGKGG